jgi:hypothetical protein
MHPFEEYLKQHNLEAISVSIKAKMRYLTVWNATRGNPITPEQAQKIRQAVFTLTGIPYTGLLQEQLVDELPTLPIQKILGQQKH